MATFISHPLFGAGASYILCQSQTKTHTQRFILLSVLCQWLPDIDTLSYLFPIDQQYALGHRGFTHSGIFALALAFAVMMNFLSLTPTHPPSVVGAFYLVFSHDTLPRAFLTPWLSPPLVSPFFWPFTAERYLFSWQPLMNIPIQFSELFGLAFWHAQWIECQFFGFLLTCLYLSHRLWERYLNRPLTSIATPLDALTPKSSSSA